MGFLSWIAKIVITKVLEFLKDLALKYGVRRIKKSKDQGHADAINAVTARIYELEDMLELTGYQYKDVLAEIEILEGRLRDLSKMDDTIN